MKRIEKSRAEGRRHFELLAPAVQAHAWVATMQTTHAAAEACHIAAMYCLLPLILPSLLPVAPGCSYNFDSLQCWMQVNAGQKYQVDYACSCCGLFGGSGDCCQPLDSCSYLTSSCGTTKPETQAFLVSTIPDYSMIFPHSVLQDAEGL